MALVIIHALTTDALAQHKPTYEQLN